MFLRELQQREARLSMRLGTAIGHSLQALAQRLALAQRGLHAVSPLATLGRGFALVTRDADGALLRSAAQVEVGADIRVRLGAGALSARVTRRETEDERP